MMSNQQLIPGMSSQQMQGGQVVKKVITWKRFSHISHPQGGGGGGGGQQQQQATDPTKSVQWQITTSLAQATANKVSDQVKTQ